MRRTGNRIVGSLFTLLFAASLLFGIRTAFAQPIAENACRYDPPTWLGACISPSSCHSRCLAQGGFQGECISNGSELCCTCAI